jgi:hypothetical protein
MVLSTMNGLRPLDAVYMGLLTFALLGVLSATTVASEWELLLAAVACYVLALLLWTLWRVRGYRPR